MATISSLPNELLIAIFTYFAADIGAGRVTTTLSLVCKFFHGLIQSHGIDVLYTLLRGMGSMHKFLRFLRNRDVAQRRVYSLLLVVARNVDNNPVSNVAVLSIIQSILSTIDPSSLHTLFIRVSLPSNDETPVLQFSVPLPSLTDLHLSGLVAISHSAHAPHTPNLTRLQLSRLYELPKEHGDDFPRLIHNLAPNLTRLKLTIRTSQLTELRPVTEFLLAVKSYLADPEARRDPARIRRAAHAFPNSLEQIVACLVYDRNQALAAPYLSRLKKASDAIAEASLLRGEIEALVVVLPQDGQQDYVPPRSEVDRGEVVYLEGFVRSWMALNVGQQEPWYTAELTQY
ncbi:hypothetical protein EIP91_004058 [Steccherinum ochraceum]|uniref:F-box domain-containing protein n=1 Tax=Steccherinum ochraceum TaxID=92696 RepID=A0A4R0RPX7_9APHY|nr:hypothetical protein EIP91_004058 [Steccherinum ochraceum]